MKGRMNSALTLATLATLGLSLGVCAGSALAEQAGGSNTNRVTRPTKQGIQLKTSNQHKVSAQGKIVSTQGKNTEQGKNTSQSKQSNQSNFGQKVEEKDESHKK